MSTWNSLTLTSTDGLDVDLHGLREFLQQHGFEGALEVWDGGESLDYDFRYDQESKQSIEDRTGARASWWSKYHDGDLGALAAALGKGWTISHVEEWDDEGPGASTVVYIDGELDVPASTSKRDVSEALNHVDFTEPETVAAILAAFPKGDPA